jgi:hypothetical protein
MSGLWAIVFFSWGANGHPDPHSWQFLQPATLYVSRERCVHDMEDSWAHHRLPDTYGGPNDGGWTCIELIPQVSSAQLGDREPK